MKGIVKPLVQYTRRCRGWRQLLALVLMTLVGTGTVAGAGQPVTATALKAAFLYNFAKFTEWPADALAPKQPLSLCVMGDAFVAVALERTIEGRQVEGHELSVRIVSADSPLRSCHLLYATGLNGLRSTQLFESVKGAAALTVSDAEGFADAGGVAQLILDGDRMRFAVNVTAAQRARLTLSSKLLGLAKVIKEGSHEQF